MSNKNSSPIGPAAKLIRNLELRDAAIAKHELERQKPIEPPVPRIDISNEHMIDLLWHQAMQSTDFNDLESSYRKAKDATLALEQKYRDAAEIEKEKVEAQHLVNLKSDWESFAPYICIEAPSWVKTLELDRVNAVLNWRCNICNRPIPYDLLHADNRTQDGKQAIHAVIDGAGLWITFRCNHEGTDHRDRPSGFFMAAWIDKNAIINHALRPKEAIILSETMPEDLKGNKPQILAFPFSEVSHGKKTGGKTKRGYRR